MNTNSSKNNDMNNDIIFNTTIKYAGCYVIGSKNPNDALSFYLKNKPKTIHRFFTKILLGWYWIDEK